MARGTESSVHRLLRDSRGNLGERMLMLAAVALSGLVGFSELGDGLTEASVGDTNADLEVVVLLAQVEQAADPNLAPGELDTGNETETNVELDISGLFGGHTLNPLEHKAPKSCGVFDVACHVGSAAGAIQADARDRLGRAGEAGGFWGGVVNFTENFGVNPDAWLIDPAGQLANSRDRIYGLGRFAKNTAVGLGTLASTTSEVSNPFDPRFLSEATTDPNAFVERRLGIFHAGVEHTISFNEWRGLALTDPKAAWEQLKNNPLARSLVQPVLDCAGDASATARNACGEVAAEIILEVLTAGAVKGAGAADDVARLADDVADVARASDEVADVADVARTVEDVADVAEDVEELVDDALSATADELASRADIAKRADELPDYYRRKFEDDIAAARRDGTLGWDDVALEDEYLRAVEELAGSGDEAALAKRYLEPIDDIAKRTEAKLCNLAVGSCAPSALKNALGAELSGYDSAIHWINFTDDAGTIVGKHAIVEVVHPVTKRRVFVSWGETFDSLDELAEWGGFQKYVRFSSFDTPVEFVEYVARIGAEAPDVHLIDILLEGTPRGPKR